ncbi:GAF domain-containing protein [uncultured Tateyamaria sp.]|uniref:GAF domain-containing protein n=1 Tax=uncultured Tateyamaria sp. TaxID=455651 RepID=UPI002638B4AC|nr:GAF domain-containing protein [uncultured Tateyamaria sp.]
MAKQGDIADSHALHDARAHLAATHEILDVMARNRDDEAPVFRAILERAERLCDAEGSGLQLLNAAGTHLVIMAIGSKDSDGSFPVDTTFAIDEPAAMCVAVREARVVHVEDMRETEEYKQGQPGRRKFVDEDGVLAHLCVPLLQDGVAFGNITLSRRAPRPFSPSEIALVETFAAQAVIAIENVRQFREVQERLARERASSEILGVISESREDQGPVFDAILRNACALCNAPLAGLILGTAQDAAQELAAHVGMFPEAIELFRTGQMKMDADLSYAARSIIEGRLIAFDDMQQSDLYAAGSPVVRSMVDSSNIRSVLFVPLLRDGMAIGNLTLFRRDVQPFDPSEIALVETFAAQAVIAIENVRQFREVQTRLERERGMAKVLSLISRSREDEVPVFDLILKQAAELCGADAAGLAMGRTGEAHQSLVAGYGIEAATQKVYDDGLVSMDPDVSLVARAIVTGEPVHVHDMADTDGYRAGVSHFLSVVEDSGIRTNLFVPLMTDAGGIGALILFRKQVKPYTDDEIALVETFAAQAVIAIENVRQFREIEARLEREAAAREVLGVISRSRDDEMPVFEAILENASRLCKAPLAFLPMANAERTHVSVPAFRGVKPDFATALNEFNEPMADSGLVAVRAVAEARIIQSADLVNDPEFPASGRWRYELVETEGARSVLLVPLMQGDIAIGAIMLYRREIAPFGPDDVELVKTFAEQAVIAIENVRQFRALEALNADLGDRVEAQVGEIERMGLLKRFLPAAVADTVVSQGSESLLKSHRALLGVLFCDIRGFTAFCETAEPEETIEVLQSYHEEMGVLIAEHGAGVDTRAGDGIMVLFNDPLPCDDPAGDALRLGLAMRARMAELSQKWRRHGHRLGFGVGISLGYATVGMVGSAGRYDYTASGTAVNLAARLCDQAKDGEILLSPRAYTAVEDSFAAETVGELSLKGIHAPVEVFRVVTGD